MRKNSISARLVLGALLLGLIIWRQWPVSSTWAVGVLVGIDLLFTGIARIVLASQLPRDTKGFRQALPA